MLQGERLERTVDALRSGFACDPDGLRTFALNLLGELTDSGATAWYRWGMVDGEPVPARFIALGAARVPVAIFAKERIPWPHADPRVPDPRWNRRFLTMRGVHPRLEEEFWPTRLYQRCYQPFGMHDQLRMTVYHRGEFIAYVGGFRGRGEPPYKRAEVRRVAPLSGAIADALVAAEATERASTPQEACDLLLRADGRVELASAAGHALLGVSQVADELRAWARAAEKTGAPPPLVRGHPVRWIRLYGREGVRYLLHLEAPRPVKLHPSFVLSRTQREVAALAAAGATVQEIAEAKTLSATTVRSHLRVVYRRLEVSSRAELARALQASP